MSAYFYADDGLIASTQAKILQRVFGVLPEIFNQVGLRKK